MQHCQNLESGIPVIVDEASGFEYRVHCDGATSDCPAKPSTVTVLCRDRVTKVTRWEALLDAVAAHALGTALCSEAAQVLGLPKE